MKSLQTANENSNHPLIRTPRVRDCIMEFNREIAFSRTIGFVTKNELLALKDKKVAIAGLGGVGGSHVLPLARLGVGHLHIADLDRFGIENFNRQAGASMATLGRTKVEVLTEMALQINPEMKITTFTEGVSADNIEQFFAGVDAYADALDFFAFKIRALVFDYCAQKSIPATTVGPIGMGAALLNFLPGQMSFRDYFQWKDSDSELDLGLKFLMGLTPKLPHASYIVEKSALNLKARKGPSTPMGCELCAGVMGAELVKILLGRGKVLNAPHSVVFDAYKNRVYHSHVWGGNRNPLQKMKMAIIRKQMLRSLSAGT
jgi:molybdopterin/thiamine biosynthesis adenylyltransferase